MPGQLTLKNTLVAGNSLQQCLNGIASNGYNLAGDNSCLLTGTGDMSSTDPLLGPLADNVGPALTHMPQPESPAIDGGQCVAGILADQGGEPRLSGAACDIGAVEAGAMLLNPPSLYLPLLRH